MGTWTTGVPYTDSTPDQITSQVGTDRSEAPADLAVTDVSDVSASASAAASMLGLVAGVPAMVTPQAGIIDDDGGARVASTTAATTLYGTAPTIPAGTIRASDVYELVVGFFMGNTEGNTRTISLLPSFGGTNVGSAESTSMVNNTFVKSGWLWMVVVFETVGTSVTPQVYSRLLVCADNNAVTSGTNIAKNIHNVAAPTVNTSNALSFGFTAQPAVSSANLFCEVGWASLSRRRAIATA